MSFKLFAYYGAICGGWAAFFGFVLGRLIAEKTTTLQGRAGMFGLALGLMLALGLSLLDSIWSLGPKQSLKIASRVLVAILVGSIGGLMGGMLGQALHETSTIFFITGWIITGMLIGASIGTFEVLASLISQKDLRGSSRKLIKCLVGGTVGGVLGGILAYIFKFWLKDSLFRDKPDQWLWTPTGWGFVALGMCIGLLVGLAQILLKEAWIKVEAGFRPGREMILAKEKTVVGRAEGSDIALFGDMGVEKMHAYIIMSGNSYFLEDANTPSGTFVNDVKVAGQTPLRSGDLIRVGKSVLRFSEKAKKNPK